MRAFERLFLSNLTGPILDVGGAQGTWRMISASPQIVLLNIGPRPDALERVIEYVQGDGCDLPFEDQSFEIAFSNSVIEHLSTKERQRAFSEEIRRVGKNYYVQTPNRWFPIEPHYLTPGVHYLPKRWQVRLLRNATVWGWMTRPSREQRQRMVDEIRLLSAGEMAELFPDAIIQRERFFGLTKSIIAIYRAPRDFNTDEQPVE